MRLFNRAPEPAAAVEAPAVPAPAELKAVSLSDSAQALLGAGDVLVRSSFPASRTYWNIYVSHPAVNAVVGKIARDFAGMPLDAGFVTDAGLDELPASNRLPALLRSPGGGLSGFDFRLHAALDVLVYGETMWLTVAPEGTRWPAQLVRLDPSLTVVQGKGTVPTVYRVGQQEFSPADVIHLKTPNAGNPLRGLSPLEALRDTLELDLRIIRWQAGTMTGAQPGSYLSRPIEAPALSDAGEKRLMAWWKSFKGGETPVLEEGMEWHPGELSAADADIVASRRFHLELVCGVYSMPGMLLAGSTSDTNLAAATWLYAVDCLGPLSAMIGDGLAAQLGPMMFGGDQSGRLHIASRMNQRLQGNYLAAAQAADVELAGNPFRTVNEVRKDRGLPAIPGGDVLPAPAKGLTTG